MQTATPSAPMARANVNLLVVLVLAQVVLFLIPLLVLGQAIGWPASLRLPAGEALPLIARNAMAVQIGYWGYLLTSVAMIPLALALRRYVHHRGALGLMVDTMTGFAIAAAVLKTLGIVRWLIAMPALATLHAGTSDPAIRTIVEISYLTLNLYAGSVGELLGVQLFSGIWLILLGLTLVRIDLRITGTAGLLVGIGFAATALRSLVPALDILSAVIPPIALAWFLALAVALWRAR